MTPTCVLGFGHAIEASMQISRTRADEEWGTVSPEAQGQFDPERDRQLGRRGVRPDGHDARAKRRCATIPALAAAVNPNGAWPVPLAVRRVDVTAEVQPASRHLQLYGPIDHMSYTGENANWLTLATSSPRPPPRLGTPLGGKTPWLNHSWHVALYVTARGLTTGPIPDGARTFQIDFDFIDHVLWIRTSDGHFRQLMLKPMPVAEFYADVMIALKELGLDVTINTMPCEIADCIPFDQDTMHASYDADAVHRFWRVLLSVNQVFWRFRTGFLGKASPVHFFWGSFDLAVTRFSGRTAPRHPGGVPHLPDSVAQEAYSHEVSSAGFWPGSPGPVDYPAFYSYAYPAPEGFSEAKVQPTEAFFSKELGEFILPYDAVRTASDPEAALMAFLQSTYAAAADLAKWDRAALECDLGEPGKVRALCSRLNLCSSACD